MRLWTKVLQRIGVLVKIELKQQYIALVVICIF